VARYRAAGGGGVRGSRRPKTSPTATSASTVELIVRLQAPVRASLDAGPDTIAWHLRQHHELAVSQATISRIHPDRPRQVFTTRLAGGKGGRNALEAELRRLHVAQKNASPYHPRTCGKVEQFQQTMKNWLRAMWVEGGVGFSTSRPAGDPSG
jgi:hypothetical protein